MKMRSCDRITFGRAVRANPQWRDIPVIGHMLCAMQYVDENNTLMAVATYGKVNEPKVKVIPSYRILAVM